MDTFFFFVAWSSGPFCCLFFSLFLLHVKLNYLQNCARSSIVNRATSLFWHKVPSFHCSIEFFVKFGQYILFYVMIPSNSRRQLCGSIVLCRWRLFLTLFWFLTWTGTRDSSSKQCDHSLHPSYWTTQGETCCEGGTQSRECQFLYLPFVL